MRDLDGKQEVNREMVEEDTVAEEDTTNMTRLDQEITGSHYLRN